MALLSFRRTRYQWVNERNGETHSLLLLKLSGVHDRVILAFDLVVASAPRLSTFEGMTQ